MTPLVLACLALMSSRPTAAQDAARDASSLLGADYEYDKYEYMYLQVQLCVVLSYGRLWKVLEGTGQGKFSLQVHVGTYAYHY